MLGCDDNVLHARVFGDLNPLLRIELNGVELPGKLFILLERDAGVSHNPLAADANRLALPYAGGYRIETPVKKQAVFRLPEPRHLLVLTGWRRKARRQARSCRDVLPKGEPLSHAGGRERKRGAGHKCAATGILRHGNTTVKQTSPSTRSRSRLP